jgi:arylsulfatase
LYKSDTYEGGIRSPLIVTWPNGEIPASIINSQYHHVIDVVPTVLTMINSDMPQSFSGTAPLPLQGVSFAYSFDTPDAPTTKSVQYFETLGDRAIWAGGWKAVARHTAGVDDEQDVQDFSESHNLAAADPERLQQMIALWRSEAERYNVLPLEDDTLTLYQNAVPAPRATYVFYPQMTRLDRLSAPDIYSYSSQFVAEIEVDETPASGVILAAGDSSCGYEWFLDDGIVHFAYVYTRNETYHVASSHRLGPGNHECELRIRKTGESSGAVELLVDSQVVAELELTNMWPIYAANSGIRCGENRHAPISRYYAPPYVLNQKLRRVVADVDMPPTG